MTIIRDASTQKAAIVDSEGFLYSLSQVHTEARHNAGLGRSFLLSSGFVTCSATGDTFASIFYFKNSSTTKVIHFGYFRTCNEVPAKWRMIKNPTSISNSTAITPLNLNFESNVVLDATAEFGSATSTTTGGTEIATWIQPGPGHSDPDWAGGLILGPNDSIALEMAPFASVAGEVCITNEVWQTELA